MSPTHPLSLATNFTCSLLAAPERSGDPWQQARRHMVERQIEARDVRDPVTLEAMRRVPRHRFVPADLQALAYDDRPLPIGHGQTISQPYIVACMTGQLALTPAMRVLEIGTGSGYQTAVLAETGAEVCTIEIVPALGARAAALLRELGYRNIRTRVGDGWPGWPGMALFDAIIVTAATESVPPPLLAQLGDGGRMVIPLGPAGGPQELMLLTRRGDHLDRRPLVPVRFVPFVRARP